MEYQEDEFLAISGIQHFCYCRRQWALAYLEQQWAENLLTTQGKLLHERAHDDQFTEKRNDLLVSRGLSVSSRTLGLYGICDVVEFRASPSGVPLASREGLWLPVPVEYKRGRPKDHQADELQLCAQAICLEEMFCCAVPKGYLYYGEPRRRTAVDLDDVLRQTVAQMAEEMHTLFRRGYTPRVKPGKQCRACSLVDLCMSRLERRPSVSDYLQSYLGGDDDP